jgi:hypothetical protein
MLCPTKRMATPLRRRRSPRCTLGKRATAAPRGWLSRTPMIEFAELDAHNCLLHDRHPGDLASSRAGLIGQQPQEDISSEVDQGGVDRRLENDGGLLRRKDGAGRKSLFRNQDQEGRGSSRRRGQFKAVGRAKTPGTLVGTLERLRSKTRRSFNWLGKGSIPPLEHRRTISSASSPETSRDQPSAVLKATTRAGPNSARRSGR